MSTTQVFAAEGHLLAGVNRQEITPPVGIYGRMWGASNHDQSEGTHRPLYTTALAISDLENCKPALLFAIDAASIGDLAGREATWLRQQIKDAIDIDDAHLMLACSHTHASPWAARSRVHMPGGEMIEKYLADTALACITAGKEAIAQMEVAILTFGQGSCSLATNRDFPEPNNPKRYLTGFNPEIKADDTLLVGRVTRVSDHKILGTLVNYACHPTSLGWDNKLISPDYVGRMREVIERETDGAPCLFLQGASGDLAPAYQYEGVTNVADQHGEQLGYASLSTLSAMHPAGEAIRFIRVVESGAPLAYWKPEQYEVSTVVEITRSAIDMPAKDWPSIAELNDQYKQATDSFARERIFRKRSIAALLMGGNSIPMSIYVWQIGKIILIGAEAEVYSIWQQEIRAAFPDYAIVAITCTDYEAIGYIVPDELHDLDLYTAWQPPFGKGSLDLLLQRSKDLISNVTGSPPFMR
jgi:hypothetical protein